jgi:hypothetical protein
MSWSKRDVYSDSTWEDGTRNIKPGLHNSSWWNAGNAYKSGLHNSSWWNASYDTPSHQQHTSWFRSEQLYGEPTNDASNALQREKLQWEKQRKHEETEITEWTQQAKSFEARLRQREADLKKRELELEKEKAQLLE